MSLAGTKRRFCDVRLGAAFGGIADINRAWPEPYDLLVHALASRQPRPSRQPGPFGRGFSLSVIALRPAGACLTDWRGTLPTPGSFASSCPLPTAGWT